MVVGFMSPGWDEVTCGGGCWGRGVWDAGGAEAEELVMTVIFIN